MCKRKVCNGEAGDRGSRNTIVQVYAPTDEKDNDTKEEFYM